MELKIRVGKKEAAAELLKWRKTHVSLGGCGHLRPVLKLGLKAAQALRPLGSPPLRCLRCKESALNVGNLGSIPRLDRSSGEGNTYPLQYSCLDNSMDRRAGRATVHETAKNRTRLSGFHSY